MNNKTYAEKIRRRKQHLKQSNLELNSSSKKTGQPWPWVISTGVILVAAIFFIYFFKDSLPEEWSNYENIMLPIALFAMALLLLILWFLPKFYVESLQNTSLSGNQSEFDREKEQLKLEDDTRKTLAQIIGGTVFLFGLIFTYNTFILNREGQITDRFTKAVAQLGDDDIAVRLGGLYALERIAKDSPKDLSTVMEILYAYIREKSPVKPMKKTEAADQKKSVNSKQEGPEDIIKIKTDVQAVLTIIGRRITKQNSYLLFNNRINLSETNLKGADFSSGDFRGADFNGADLSNANLVIAHLDHSHLNRTNLEGANLRIASLEEAYLKDANLSHAVLMFANLSNADLKGVNFDGATLIGTNLIGASNLTYEQLKTAIISEETLLPAYLESRKQELLDLSKNNLGE